MSSIGNSGLPGGHSKRYVVVNYSDGSSELLLEHRVAQVLVDEEVLGLKLPEGEWGPWDGRNRDLLGPENGECAQFEELDDIEVAVLLFEIGS